MATVTLIVLALLRAQPEQMPHLLCGGTGRLRPVGEKTSVAEARQEIPAANAWSDQLRSPLTLACRLA